MSFVPRLDVLPAAQRELWPELKQVPRHFVLYGGTALALRLGHRQSVDFDFFSSESVDTGRLLDTLPLLRGCQVRQAAENTLTVSVNRAAGDVLVSFIGGLPWQRVKDPEQTDDGVLQAASLLDIAATKLRVIWARNQAKDFVDIDALLQHGVSLEDALGAASAVYGEQFEPLISVKSLTHFAGGDLPSLPEATKQTLRVAAAKFRGKTTFFVPKAGGLAGGAKEQ
jgi:hypothetical protein